LIEDRIDRDDVGVPEMVVGAPLGPKSRGGLVMVLGGTARSACAIASRDPAKAAPTAIAPTSVRRDTRLPSRPLSSCRVMALPPPKLMPIVG